MTLQKSLRSVTAYYEVHARISIFTRLILHGRDDARNTLTFSVGIRSLHDTTLPLGSRLVLKESEIQQNNSKKMYTVRVIGSQLVDGVYLHTASILGATTLEYDRKDPRQNIELEAFRSEQVRFKTVNISHGGLQFCYGTKLTSALLSENMPLFLEVGPDTVAFECRPRYIIYNWWEQRHMVGAEFVNLTPLQQSVLNKLLGEKPSEKPPIQEISDLLEAQFDQPLTPAAIAASLAEASTTADKIQKIMIDPESGRIRFDRL